MGNTPVGAEGPKVGFVNGRIIDAAAGTLRDHAGRSIELRPQSFSVLLNLYEHPNELVTKEELMQSVWPGIAVTDDSLVQCIHEIRRAIDDDKHIVLKTIPRRGYRLDLPEQASSPVSAATTATNRYHTFALLMVAVIAGAMFWWLQPKELLLAGRPSIAVLPFENIGGDEMAGRFADGITEDIITDLSRYRAADVIARNSTAIYKGKPIDIRQIGKDLDVRYALEGSVQREGEQLRVTVQFIDVKNGAHIWSNRWDRPVADLFEVQSEISDQVANRLMGPESAVVAAELVSARRASPKDMTAYGLYLRGQELLQNWTKESINEALPLLKQAVQQDPLLARAWDELSAAYNASIDFGADPVFARAESLKAAQRAVALDPMDALAHAHLAHILGMQGELDRAKVQFEQALRLNPGSAEVLMIYASWATTFESAGRAAEYVDKVIRLNPNYPSWATGPFSFVYVMAARYADALRILERESTDNYTVYSWIHRAVSNAMLDRPDEAKLWVAKTLEKHPNLTIQGYLSPPDWTDADRNYLIPLLRKAGFPSCAKHMQPREKLISLSECEVTVAP